MLFRPHSRMSVGRVWFVAALSLSVLLMVRGESLAQDEVPAPVPDVAAPLAAVSAAFQAIVDSASTGDWQAADAAFNGALDAMDLYGPQVVDALGDPARGAFARVDGLIVPLVAALDAEDVPRARTTVALIRHELEVLLPTGSGIAPATAETQTVLAWQDTLRQIAALAEQQAWRDMRNASMSLTDSIQREGARIVAAAGPESLRSVDTARVFALRLIAAAQNQAPSSARASGAQLSQAIDELLMALGALPAQVPVSPEDVRMRFRVHHTAGDPGDVVDVGVVAEAVPRIGLGSFDLELGWSPEALRLVDTSWTMSPGSARRDDAAGQVRLTLPPAPTGPSGDVELLRLRFEVLPQPPRAADYLPADETDGLMRTVSDARRLVREGDVPNAAIELERAYLSYVNGADQAGSLYDRLSRYDLAAPLAASVMLALDVTSRPLVDTSQPAEADVILLSLSELEGRATGTWEAYLQSLGGSDGVPISTEVLAVSDTTGAPLDTLDPVPGLVLRSEALVPSASATLPAVESPVTSADGAAVIVTPALDASLGAGSNADVGTEDSNSDRQFPVALVVAMLVAVGAGLVVLVVSGGDGNEDVEADGTGDPTL